MKPSTKRTLLAIGVSALSGIAFIHCGSDTGSSLAPNSNIPGSVTDLGNFNLACGGQSTSGQTQKQVPFQQQQQSGCTQQRFTYAQQKAVDLDVNLDCKAGRVLVQHKGIDPKQQSLPIQDDGTVKGSLQFQQQVESDNRGHQRCWVAYQVNLDGKAQCGAQAQPAALAMAAAVASPTPSRSPSPAPFVSPSALPLPSPSASANASSQGKLTLTTTVSFQQSTADALRQAGIQGQIVEPDETPSLPLPSGTPIFEPIPSGTPSQLPSQIPSQLPSQLPSPSPSATVQPLPTVTLSPLPSPTPTGTPVVVCEVEDPCPIVGQTDLSCGQ